MKVAVLFSGGKDSTFAIQYAKEKNWDIEYLLSIKPTRTDCFLFHYATVEHTYKIAEVLGIKHYLLTCDFADPKKEASLVAEFVLRHKVDSLLLGGTGLQLTQIKSLQDALHQFNIEVFATHSGLDHDDVMIDMLNQGYKIMISQIASDGLNKDWLGRVLDEKNMKLLFERSKKYGFHAGGEGGYYDTFVLDAPFFNKRLEVTESKKVMESENSGHLVVEELKAVDKIKVKN